MGPLRRNPAEILHEEQSYHVVFKAKRLGKREKIQCYGSKVMLVMNEQINMCPGIKSWSEAFCFTFHRTAVVLMQGD